MNTRLSPGVFELCVTGAENGERRVADGRRKAVGLRKGGSVMGEQDPKSKLCDDDCVREEGNKVGEMS